MATTVTTQVINQSMGGRLITPITGDATITITPYSENTIVLSKATAAAITLPAPTAITDDGKRLHFISQTAAAHVITSSVDGFNAKGSSGTLTFATSPLGIQVTVEALDGHWYARPVTGITIG